MIAALWPLAGFAAGAAHFALLRWNTRLYLTGGGFLRAAGAQLLRLAGMACLLGFAVWNGALPLLLAATGLMLARLLVLRTTLALP
jgi:N-ATPase, AtpR subunit